MPKKTKKEEEQAGSNQTISLKSPRTVEAAKRQGYLMKELKFIPYDKYKESIVDLKITEDIIKLRWERLEAKRKEKIQTVVKERQVVIDEIEEEKEAKVNAKKSHKIKPNNSAEAIDSYVGKSIIKNRNSHQK